MQLGTQDRQAELTMSQQAEECNLQFSLYECATSCRNVEQNVFNLKYVNVQRSIFVAFVNIKTLRWRRPR